MDSDNKLIIGKITQNPSLCGKVVVSFVTVILHLICKTELMVFV
jgi:hypothetical protein